MSGGPKTPTFDEVVAPIFDFGRGQRLATVRMKMGLTQAELGLLLNVSQRTMSRIESGGGAYCTPTLTADLLRSAIDGQGFRYVLFGTGSSYFNVGKIRSDFMDSWLAKIPRRTSRKHLTQNQVGVRSGYIKPR